MLPGGDEVELVAVVAVTRRDRDERNDDSGLEEQDRWISNAKLPS